MTTVFGYLPLTQSTTVADGDFHIITTADGVETRVCLNPVKTINGVAPDTSGNINPVDMFSTTVDNGDGTYTTTSADGTQVTWSGDTFATQTNNGDGTVTFTMSDGSSVTLCLDPVKDVLDSNGNSIVINGVAQLPELPDSGSDVTITDSGDGTVTIDVDGTSCPVSTLIYDDSATCDHILRDAKTGAEVTRFGRDRIEFTSVGEALDFFNIEGEINSMQPGDTLEKEVCATYTIPDACANRFGVVVSPHLTTFTMTQVPPEWWGRAILKMVVDGFVVEIGADYLDTRGNTAPEDQTLLAGAQYVATTGVDQANPSTEVCLQLCFTLDGKGAGAVDTSSVGGLTVHLAGHKQL